MASEKEEGVFHARTSACGEWDFSHRKSLVCFCNGPACASADDQGVLAIGYPVQQLYLLSRWGEDGGAMTFDGGDFRRITMVRY
jgi:hypothetical protein